MSAGISLSTIASVVGVAAGAKSLMSSGSSGGQSGGASNGAISDASAAQAAESTRQSKDLYDYWRANYKPLEQSTIEQAKTFGTPADIESAAGAAGATTAQQFGGARKSFTRQQASYGVNPSSGAAIDANRQSLTDEAAATAGAENNARLAERQAGLNAQVNVAQTGRGLVGNSLAASTAATGANSVAGTNANTAFANTNTNSANTGAALSAISTGAQNIYKNLNLSPAATPSYSPGQGSSVIADNSLPSSPALPQYALPDYSAGSSANNYRKGGLIRPPRNYAKGGKVTGPGTGTSDSVPVVIDGHTPGALSNGEYVINAKAVKKAGLRKLDAINLAGLPKGAKMKGGTHLAEGGKVETEAEKQDREDDEDEENDKKDKAGLDDTENAYAKGGRVFRSLTRPAIQPTRIGA